MPIFVDTYGSTGLRVSGDTYHLNKLLGCQGLKFKFNKDKKEWRGDCSLKALQTLREQSGAILTSRALEEMKRFEKAAAKRAAYMKII